MSKPTGDNEVDSILQKCREARETDKVLAHKHPDNGKVCALLREIEAHLTDNPPMTEERIMKEYEAGKKVGEEQERGRIAKMIEEIACQFFLAEDHDRSNTNGELASRYRDLARRIKTGK